MTSNHSLQMKRITILHSHVCGIHMPVAALVLCCAWFATYAAEPSLSVDETLGAVFLPVSGAAAHANPDAKPLLYRLLDNNQIEQQHSRIHSMLGYIGNGTDATNLEVRLKERYVGTLNAGQWGGVQATLWGLSTMASRGIGEASEILEQMTKRTYWEDIKLHSVEGVNYPHGIVNELTMQSLVAYARSGREGLEQKILAFKEELRAEPIALETAEWRLDSVRLTEHAKAVREAEVPPISPENRKLLGRAFNGDFNNPGLAPIEALRGTNVLQNAGVGGVASNVVQTIPPSALATLAKEAQDAFTRIMDDFLNNRYEECAKTLADNGKPLLPMEKQSEATISATAQELKAMSRDIQATQAVLGELKAAGITFGEAHGEMFADGKVIVRIPWLGSRQVKSRHLARHHETRTTDSQGQLVIYMIKQDGQWFWNPFGW